MVKSNPNTNQEEMKVIMKVVEYYFTEEGGMVIIYRVVPPEDAILDEFYVVSFDDTAGEYVWGVGPTPEAALKSASRRWKEDNEEDNGEDPFEEVLQLKGE